MQASEKMARRVELVGRLTDIDNNLKLILGLEPSNRATADARRVLGERRSICSQMRVVGYQAWPLPAKLDEAKVV